MILRRWLDNFYIFIDMATSDNELSALPNIGKNLAEKMSLTIFTA